MAIKFATKSNTKGAGVFSMEDFKEIGAKSKRTVKDLYYKDGAFTIASAFVKDQAANVGWTVGIDEDVKKVYLVRTTVDGEPEAKFLKGDNVSRKFTSDALELPLKTYGVDLTQELFLNKIDEDIYEVSNIEAVEAVAIDNGDATPVTAPQSLAIDNDDTADAAQDETNIGDVIETSELFTADAPEAVDESLI